MADTKISAATNTTAPLVTDMLPLARAADTTARKITVGNLRGGVFNVKDYGADPSASAATNDTAIAAAIAAAAVLGGTVIIPPGTYNISATVTLPRFVRLSGGGYRCTTLKCASAGMTMLSVTDINASIVDIIFSGDNTASVGIILNGANECRLVGVYIIACTLGIKVGNGTATTGIWFDDLVVTGCLTALEFNNATEIWIDNSNIFGSAAGGLWKAITVTASSNYIFINNTHFESFDFVFYLTGAVGAYQWVFNECHFISTRDAGINATRFAYIAATTSIPNALRLLNSSFVLTNALYIIEFVITDSNSNDMTITNCTALSSTNAANWLHSTNFDVRLVTRYYGNLPTTLANEA